MVLLGDKTQLEARFGSFGDSANLDARSVHGFAPNVPQAQKSFSTHPMELLGDVGHVESRSVRFEMVLALVQDRCTDCAKHTIGLDIIQNAPDGTPR